MARHIGISPLMNIFASVEGGVTIDLRNERHSGSINFCPDGLISFTAIGIGDDFGLTETYQEIDEGLLESVGALFGPAGYSLDTAHVGSAADNS